MTVTTSLPFDFCDRCMNADPDIIVDKLYGDGEVVEVMAQVVCANANFCKRFEKMGYRMVKSDNGPE